ncbi:tetratricopeptide repeat protein 28-like [Oculina patagonica]
MNLANIYERRCEYAEARELYEKAINITRKASDRAAEATSYGNLAHVFHSLGEYDKAKEYNGKALAINIEIGNRAGEAAIYGNLGTVFHSLGEYDKAKEYFEKALAINIEIDDRAGEASCYGNLGCVFQSLGEYEKAKEYPEKALAINIEIHDRAGEAANYGNLGNVFKSLGEYDKAKEYYEKALAINFETGNRAGEAANYGNLGTVFESLGEYDKAKEHHEKALAIKIEIGDRAGEAANYGNLGTVFQSLGEYEKAREYLEKALAIRMEIGDRAGEATCYGNLGAAFQSLCEYDKAKEYHEKALAIKIEIGDRAGVATFYGNLGTVFHCLGEYEKAKEYYKKALTISMEIGEKDREALDYGNLGTLYHSLGEHVMAEGYLEKALIIFQDTGNAANELSCYCNLTSVKLSQGKIQEAFQYLLLSINKSEDLRSFLKDNDQFKIAFSDVHHLPYHNLSAFFCLSGNPYNALYVLELARARALADLMENQYTIEMQISANPQSWIGIENIMKKESNCACLYISYYDQDVFLWILKTSGVIHFRRITVNENIIGARLVSSLHDFLSKSFRSLGILSQQDCEDRSLNGIEAKPKSFKEEILADLRLVEKRDDDEDDNQDPERSLPLFYKMIIAPVADLLDEPKIILVPDRSLFRVPFAALTDEGGKYLSEIFRIRIVPSLTTFKLIQDSPADYHSQSGALIVGDPVVGRVRYKGCRTTFNPLPCARKEAEMIGRLLGVQPLLGEHATKQAVLQAIHSVSLIHFAAHGNAERGEIALSPLCTATGIPHEEDYLLTMSDISQVRLRAKLVVLSCCHSGCGQIRAEGVVGIARAFLGSGARSVLVALWAIEDRATEQFMSRFYERLVCGESASESLHETMKWMRDNGFAKVSEWAPFMLIGDNVTFDIEKLKKARELESDPACSKQ